MSIVFGEFYDDHFTDMLLKIGTRSDFLGPRDWSPAINRAKQELQTYKDSVPPGMLLSMSEVEDSGFLRLSQTVNSGGAFAIRIEKTLHLVFVTSKGRIWMDKVLQKFFKVDG